MSVFAFTVSLLIAFALGYEVRAIVSRRRRKKYLRRDRQDANRLNPIELEVLRSNEDTGRSVKINEGRNQRPESPEHVK
jgi:hypothetical protein